MVVQHYQLIIHSEVNDSYKKENKLIHLKPKKQLRACSTDSQQTTIQKQTGKQSDLNNNGYCCKNNMRSQERKFLCLQV